ncbi:MAG: hypothetical protein DRQ55_06730 [Planctomycetota bacterium]|nr:MAG: hypothetical protein DRQ55_06730 [Planctomycetota bacterium]
MTVDPDPASVAAAAPFVQSPPVSGWSGGQASVARVSVALAAALALLSTLGAADGWGASGARAGMGLALAALCAALALGWRTREVSLALLAFAAMAFGLPAGPALGPLALGAALLVLAWLPAAPLLSWEARGRADPRGAWRWPRAATALARLACVGSDLAWLWWFSTGSSADAMPQELLPRGGWVLCGEAGAPLLGASWLLAWAALHLLGFGPVSLAPRSPGADALLLFDGDCALCHGTVRWLLAEDRLGLVQTAPLQGATAAARLDERQRAGLPDSLVLITEAGTLRTRSDAVVGLLLACGGLWRPLGALLWAIPRPLRDGGYRAVAALRSAVFGRAKDACPLLPADLTERLLP